MKPQITSKQNWWKIDGSNGTEYFPCEYFGRSDALEAYGVCDADTVEEVSGYGCRLSMPGYLDCTDWIVFPTVAEAAQSLLDMFYDCADDELTDQERAEARELESLA